MKPLIVTITTALLLGLAASSPSGVDEQWTQAELEAASRKIQGEIEELRATKFIRPVKVELSDGDQFLAYMQARIAKMQPEEDLVADEIIAKHLGLIPPDLDLLALTMEVLEEQVGGFYAPGTDTFYLMESFTGGLARIILAHELTHALDDQLFDLDALLEERSASGDAEMAFSAVVEGSGTVVMSRWAMRNLGDLNLEDLQQASKMGMETLSNSPPFVWKPLLAIYVRGQAFLEAGRKHLKKLAKQAGEEPDANLAIEMAFANPPRSTEQILHPDKYWKVDEQDEPRPIRHAIDELPEGWKLMQRDVMGELVTALFTETLDDRVNPDLTNQLALLAIRYTNQAAEGWGGDELVLLGNGSGHLVHWVTVWDTERDAREFRAAVKELEPHLATSLRALSGGVGGTSGTRLSDGADARTVALALWSGVASGELGVLLDALRYEEL